MAVQAQYPSNTALFPTDFPINSHQAATPLGAAATQTMLPQHRQVLFGGTTMFSGEPESELTCNVSGSRKRALDGYVAPTLPSLNLLIQQQQQQLWLANAAGNLSQGKLPAAAGAGVSAASFLVSHHNCRLNESAMSSTSGRAPAGAPVSAQSSQPMNPLGQEVVSQLYSQSHEIDTLIRLQNERLRSGLQEARKRHCRVLLSAMEQAVVHRLREKEAELESVSRRNSELEEKVRQMAAENQIWFNVARNSEAIVSSLRANLEQVLQNAGAAGSSPSQVQDVEEGYGDSDCVAPAIPATDAQSCCYGGEAPAAVGDAVDGKAVERRLGRACKVCMEQEVSVLLLPCRHLCLCKQCADRLDACPVCNDVKSASLQIFMS